MKFGDNSLSSQYISANYCRNIHAIYLLWFADVFGGGVRGRGGGGYNQINWTYIPIFSPKLGT